jgi:hypothetical protein
MLCGAARELARPGVERHRTRRPPRQYGPAPDPSLPGHAARAFLTVHHWDGEQRRGVTELRRVACGPVIIVTYDHNVSGRMWLMKDYLPEVARLDARIFPSCEQLAAWLGGHTEITTLEISRDTPDWMLGSFWAHPERVLDPTARAGTSGFARMDPGVVDRVVREVRADLQDGSWDRRYGALRDRQSLDVGLRLLANTPGSRGLACCRRPTA